MKLRRATTSLLCSVGTTTKVALAASKFKSGVGRFKHTETEDSHISLMHRAEQTRSFGCFAGTSRPVPLSMHLSACASQPVLLSLYLSACTLSACIYTSQLTSACTLLTLRSGACLGVYEGATSCFVCDSEVTAAHIKQALCPVCDTVLNHTTIKCKKIPAKRPTDAPSTGGRRGCMSPT